MIRVGRIRKIIRSTKTRGLFDARDGVILPEFLCTYTLDYWDKDFPSFRLSDRYLGKFWLLPHIPVVTL